MTGAANRFGRLRNLRNESDVEQNFLVPLLDLLGFTEDFRRSKASIATIKIGKGKKRRDYRPDFICYLDKKHARPVLVIDAKNPDVDAEEGVQDAQLYIAVMRRSIDEPKPHQFCIGSNGRVTLIRPFESNDDVFELQFADFNAGQAKFEQLVFSFSREALEKAERRKIADEELWSPQKPPVEEIKAAFQKCHNRIWKRESLFPTAAFYEFTKLIFLKLREDERLHQLIDKGEPVRMKDLHFHTDWISPRALWVPY